MMLAGAVQATDFSMSVGGGGFAGGHFTRYSLSANGKIDAYDGGVRIKAPVEVFSGQDIDQFNVGGFVFFDATWVEFNVSILHGSYEYRQTMYAKNNGEVVTGSEDPETGRGWETMLGLSLFGKYPFMLNTRFTVFPLAGLDYQLALLQLRQIDGFSVYDRADGIHEMKDTNDRPYRLSAWNALFVVLGGGMDFNFHESFFLRTELLYSIRLQTPWEVDNLKRLKESVNAPDPKLSGLSSGPTLKAAVGWRFH
jgi:hypothetical protein